MTNVLILGANGQLARNTTRVFLGTTDAKLTLFLRRASRLSNPDPERGGVLDPYRDSAAVIEASDLDYTILRPGWFTGDHEVSYQLTQKGQAFKGHDVSLNSVSALVVKLATTPALHVRRSLGVSRG
jgi:uncharacterized protein YbjT (DUF2867 family)